MKLLKVLTVLLFIVLVNLVDSRRKKRRRIKKKKWIGKVLRSAQNVLTSVKDKLTSAAGTLQQFFNNTIKTNTYSWVSNGVAKDKFKFNPADRLNLFSADVANYWTKLASYGYCHYENMLNNTCCTDLFRNKDFVFVGASKIDKDNYNIGIIRSDKFKKIVVSLPGTRDHTQLLKEVAQGRLVGFDNSETITTLKYFNQVYDQLKDPIFSKLKKEHEKYPDYQVVFTGHSLGGAMATLFSLGAVRNKIINKTTDSPVLITFGAPRPGNDVFANEVMLSVPIVFRIVRQGDAVPVVPPCLSDKNNTICSSVLPDDKFLDPSEDPSINENDNSSNLPASSNYYQIGGLKLFNREFTDYNECPKNQGEFHVNDPCDAKRTTDVELHVVYSGIRVGNHCKNNRRKKFF